MRETEQFIEIRNSFTDRVAQKTPDQISQEYSYMTLAEHTAFVSEILKKLNIQLKGDGMEVAAGAAVLCCSIAKIFPEVNKVYALEIVEEVVKKLQPKIIEASEVKSRVIPMHGDFNNINLPDNSLDFALGFDSLHHSEDLAKTFKEIGRVLKPGGKLIFFDRAHPNSMSKAQEEFLVHTEYSTAYKIQYGLDPNKSYRRFENGEHEPRLSDWAKAMTGSEMKFDSITIFSKRKWLGLRRILISQIPYFVRSFLKLGRNLTAHPKLILFYLFPTLGKYGKIKIFPLEVKLETPTSPLAKWVFVASKR